MGFKLYGTEDGEGLAADFSQLAGEDCHCGVGSDKTARWMFGGPNSFNKGVAVRSVLEDRTAFVDTEDLVQEAFIAHTEARKHIGMAPSVLDGRKAGLNAYIEITRDMARTVGDESLRVSSDVQRAIFGDVFPTRKERKRSA